MNNVFSRRLLLVVVIASLMFLTIDITYLVCGFFTTLEKSWNEVLGSAFPNAMIAILAHELRRKTPSKKDYEYYQNLKWMTQHFTANEFRRIRDMKEETK